MCFSCKCIKIAYFKGKFGGPIMRIQNVHVTSHQVVRLLQLGSNIGKAFKINHPNRPVYIKDKDQIWSWDCFVK